MTRRELRKAIGDNIKRWRTERDMTQAELAEAAGVAQANISQFERGRASPSIDTIADLATALRIPPDLLLRSEIFSEIGA